MYLLLRTSKTREFVFFTLKKTNSDVFYFTRCKNKKAKNSDPKNNLVVIKKIEVRCGVWMCILFLNFTVEIEGKCNLVCLLVHME